MQFQHHIFEYGGVVIVDDAAAALCGFLKHTYMNVRL